MGEFLLVIAAISAVWTAIHLLRVTFHVCINDPKFSLKAFTIGLLSSMLGYLKTGHVTIDIVLWGMGGIGVFIIAKIALG